MWPGRDRVDVVLTNTGAPNSIIISLSLSSLNVLLLQTRAFLCSLSHSALSLLLLNKPIMNTVCKRFSLFSAAPSISQNSRSHHLLPPLFIKSRLLPLFLLLQFSHLLMGAIFLPISALLYSVVALLPFPSPAPAIWRIFHWRRLRAYCPCCTVHSAAAALARPVIFKFMNQLSGK